MADDRRAEAGRAGARPELVHRTGGNIYFLAKIGATDGKSFQQMAGSMTGMTEEEYRDMMIRRPLAEGNRYLGEDGDAQAQHQPQGRRAKKGA
jgi:protocatechuate 4,5-dioxygenase alpha chain